MKNFFEMNGGDLAEIIIKKEHTVIAIDQLTAKTVGNQINKRYQYSIPNLPKEELERVLALTALAGIEDRETLWNSFVLIASNLGADISYFNANQVDCYVELRFE